MNPERTIKIHQSSYFLHSFHLYTEFIITLPEFGINLE